ncbi:heavy metal translocating P-type ATPase [Bacillus sp. SJS]|uniref:heavy metal translocating P-type ATPase n=1 Tax=Bacillus sp. SJS TaxID=1423321 RepID=UPI0004DCF4D6|nr:heavy metal translocating P-type ATPase [Bacillus sp. SJS]KZZ82647.1 ATPase P [Bacillus sp. SJS]
MSRQLKETNIGISGMTCAACAARIEKGLKKLDGIEEANVNLALERSSIQYDAKTVSLSEIHAKIKDLGYEPEGIKDAFSITGMTCSACAARIEKGLNKTHGVYKASVNLATESASVEYNPADTGPKEIINRIEKLGYGAAVKKEDKEAGDRRLKEIQNQQGKFLFSMILSIPLLWAMVSHFSFTSFIYLPDMLMNPWVQLAFATPVQFIAGGQFYKGAYHALRNKGANMDVLVALGTSTAYLYSLFITFKSISLQEHIQGLYFETSAILITLILLGKMLETQAKGRSSESIKKLMGLQAKTASVYRDGQEMTVPLEEVVKGDLVFVKPGEKIPVDGEIIEGRTAIDESMLTGESIPSDKAAGDSVFGSTINKNGFIKFRAAKVGKETALAQIIKVVEEAQSSKAPIQRLADQISGVFVPVVLGLAFLTFLVWIVWINPGEFTSALEKLIAVLVIACPCALGLATPTSIMAGSGRAAEYGILFKGGEHLEAAHRIDTVLLDKTGTVTNGTPVLTDVNIISENENQVLSILASAENQSEHPLAKAITDGIKERGIPLAEVQEFETIPGYGIRSAVNGDIVLAGTRKLMEENGIEISQAIPLMKKLEGEGKTAMLIGINGTYAGLISVADTIKANSAEAVKRLKDMNVRVIMVTGDNERTAKTIAAQAGIDEVIAEVLPEEKAAAVKRLQKEGKRVAMVGDGINDAPALASADIGMAIGTGTDVAMEAADITLIRGDLNRIADALFMSRKTIRNIKQNLFWAFGYNVIGIPIAAAGFLAPWLAGAAMAFSSVSVVLNALRLQRVKLK